MSPENHASYYRPFEAIERTITQKAEIAKTFPQQIGIDGLSVVGKGTLAKRLASLLDVPYFNTGLVYRAITVYLQQERIAVQTLNGSQLTKRLQDLQIHYPGALGPTHIDIETSKYPKHDVFDLTQTAIVENAVPSISGILPIRQKVEAIQHAYLHNNPSCIMEGRNMREVMKDIPSENKFLMYVFAAPDELARRLQTRRDEPFEVAKQSVLARIRADYNHEFGRVYPPYEAQSSGEYDFLIDSTFMQHPEVVLSTLTALTEKVQRQTSILPASLPIIAPPTAIVR